MSSILLVVKMVSRLGSYQTKDNATNNPSTRQHRPLWGMPRKQMQALASLRSVPQAGFTPNETLFVDDFIVANRYPNIMNSSTHEPRNLVYYYLSNQPLPPAIIDNIRV